MTRHAVAIAALAALLACWGLFGASGGCRPASARAGVAEGSAERLVARVLARYPHDPGAFTQGLVLHDGWLYESTGRDNGEARLRQVDPRTGLAVRERVLPPAPDGSTYWGEGLARVGGRLIQLTYLHGVAFEYELATFQELGRLAYEGEGWGLCHDGSRLVMSDGSDRLTLRDPVTFAPLGSLAVHDQGRPVRRLNELECVGGRAYANVFTTDEIASIDLTTGAVRTWIDASGLLSEEERARANVLNGIAHDPRRGTFLLTGKWWPWLFEVVFEPDRAPTGAAYVPSALRPR